MILDDYVDVYSYEYHYPVEEWMMQQFRKRPNREQNFIDFLQEFALSHITYGVHHNAEDEDWHRLKILLMGRLYDYKIGQCFPTREIFILLDQALLLEHDGNAIPNLIR